MSDLTGRLRALGMPGSVHRITADEAADRIEELDAEVKRLKFAVVRYRARGGRPDE